MSHVDDFPISRRNLLVGVTATTAVSATGIGRNAQAQVSAPAMDAPSVAPTPDVAARPNVNVSFVVNGTTRSLDLDPRTTLLDAVREHLHLMGTKKGCDHGQCGACTVILNGRRINSCLTLAVMHQGDSVVTIEGLGTPDYPNPIQAAFIEHDGYQCGYCTPGQICSAAAVLDEIKAGIPSHVTADLTQAPHYSEAELRERMSGNICRCGAYSNIVEAINDVVRRQA